MKKKFFNSFWVIYGYLYGPIEALVIILLRDSNGKIGIWKLIGVLLAFAAAYQLIPLIIRLLLKPFKIDFFNDFDMDDTYIPVIVSLIIVWVPLLIYATKSEGIISMIIFTVLFGSFIIGGQVGIMGFIGGIRTGTPSGEENAKQKNKTDDSPSLKMTEIIGKDGRTKTAYTLKNGNISHTTVTNEFGNVEDEFTAIKHKM